MYLHLYIHIFSSEISQPHTYKVYKELESMLKVSEIQMSVDKVLPLAKTNSFTKNFG